MKGTPFGRYELLRKVAAGGMAEIYLARQWGQGGFFRDVVIKRLFSHMAEHPQALRMFQYEARLLAELCHPNIPQVTDLGCVDGTWYLAMEYVDGHNVADLWRAGVWAQRGIPHTVALAVVAQAAEGLHHAHDRRDRGGHLLKIVHRDVTPHNIMLTRDGVVKLLDFGVAQTAARADTDLGVPKGTYSYMAPEQVRGLPVDRRADVFALGVILFELTTGTRLFRGNDVAVMTSIVEQDAPPPSSRVEGYPSDLEAIVMKALSRDREARLGSAAELAHALVQFAVDHRLLLGTRTIADYTQAVIPAEIVREDEELSLVASALRIAEAARPADWRAEVEESTLVDDAEGILKDLDLLADPASEVVEALPDPLELPTALPELDDSPSAPGRVRQASSPRALAGFDESTGENPVVLLESPPAEKRERDYVRDLERRLRQDEPE